MSAAATAAPEDVKVNVDERKQKSCCSLRRLCCCVCCCFCTIVIALGIAAAVLYAAYEEPSVEVVGARFHRMTVMYNPLLRTPKEVQADINVTLRLDNPSRSPIGAILKNLKTTAYSLDKTAADEVGTPMLIGFAKVPDEVTIEPESTTDFVVTVTMSSEAAKEPGMLARLPRDCNGVGSQITKVRLNIQEATVAVFGIDVNLEDIDADFELSCSPSGR
eukprot:TRINITY_DN1080_c0_g1_i1.p1 TRINITY_DN1080_c0_g1~~TRINITY_DN1080_c0_g1_i1.p1  ORF type:complete len:219 (+),score=51.63 TRINITY_DN1080_c0_g1_i1:95-751(+)